jgi:hypothetical protein
MSLLYLRRLRFRERGDLVTVHQASKIALIAAALFAATSGAWYFRYRTHNSVTQ